MTHLSSDEETPYHVLTKPFFTKDEWDHDYYELVDTVDANLKQSGPVADRPAATDVPDYAWYEATDEGLIYGNDPQDGWVVIGFGSADNPVPAAFIDALTIESSSGDGAIDFSTPNQGAVLTFQDADGEFNFDAPLNVQGNTVWSASNFDPSTKLNTSNPSSSGTFVHGGNFRPDQFRTADVANAANGQAIVSNGDGTFSMSDVGADPAARVIENPNGNIQTVELEDGESTEISVAVPSGNTLNVYRWGAYNISNSTAPTGLQVQLLDDEDSVVQGENTVDSRNVSSGVAWYENSTGGTVVCKLRVDNSTGNTIQAGGFFAYRVE